MRGLLALWVAPLALCLSPQEPPAPAGAAPHEARELFGFRVQVESSLLSDGDALGRDALELLRGQLFEVTRHVPAPALAKLREVTIRLDRDHPVAPCGVYHPSRAWLVEHGYEAGLARVVQIANARNFLDWSREQPWMVLHELAHAYHDQVLGHDHAGIRAAWERARGSAAWGSVLHASGAERRHYALENDQEWFAEASEAWFGTNDFFPFVRAEFSRLDPEAGKLMQALWGG
jgi:hypothetical protein